MKPKKSSHLSINPTSNYYPNPRLDLLLESLVGWCVLGRLAAKRRQAVPGSQMMLIETFR